jgi:hypothetical protein
VTRAQLPDAYWDKSELVPKDFKTNEALPNYVGIIFVYLDVTGPTLMNTFFVNGKRAWVPVGEGAYLTNELLDKAATQ